VENANASVVRAWQAHKIEKKAFFPVSGKTKIVLVPVLDFEKSIGGKAQEVILDADNPKIIVAPPGFANGIQGLGEGASVIVFSNLYLSESINDDYRFEKNLWYEW
jgi:dTDP-4-dehydrorhamnose 3,5-epimerase